MIFTRYLFNVFLFLKNVGKIKKNVRNVKKRDKNKNVKKRFSHLCENDLITCKVHHKHTIITTSHINDLSLFLRGQTHRYTKRHSPLNSTSLASMAGALIMTAVVVLTVVYLSVLRMV